MNWKQNFYGADRYKDDGRRHDGTYPQVLVLGLRDAVRDWQEPLPVLRLPDFREGGEDLLRAENAFLLVAQQRQGGQDLGEGRSGIRKGGARGRDSPAGRTR